MHYSGITPMLHLPGFLRLTSAANRSLRGNFRSTRLAGLALLLPLAAAAQPAISQVTTPASGAYNRTLALQFTVRFNAPVIVQGAPRLALQVGTATRYATLISSLSPSPAGSNLVSFEYVPTAVDADDDGITLAGGIDLNGGAIKAADATQATLTFTPPDTRGVKISVLRPPTPRIAAAIRGGAKGDNLVLEGSADGSSMILISRADIGLVGVTMAAPNGAWTFEYAAARVGTFQFSVAAENSDGVVSADSAPLNVTIVHTASDDSADEISPASA